MKKLCVVLLLTASALQAQDIIRAEAREVLVDVTVTGKGDTSNLTAKDFSVWEDGKQQKINSVSAGTGSDDSPKHFVLLFDFTTMGVGEQVESEKAASEFIEGMASPDRFMAVVTLGAAGSSVVQNFTTAKAALLRATAAPISPTMRTAGDVGGVTTSICQSMEATNSRKVLFLFSGYSNSGSNALPYMIAACNRANVAVDMIWTRQQTGMQSENGRFVQAAGRGRGGLMTPQGDSQDDVTVAERLATGTGGESFPFSENLPAQMAAVARAQDDSYRISYTPPPAKEGSCHKLKVTTAIRGAVLHARKEYCTEKQVDIVAGKIAGQALEAKAGTGNLSATMALPWFYTGANRASVHLAVDVIPAGMKFEKDKDGLHGQIDLVGSAVRADGGTAARFADTVDLDAPDQQKADALTKTPYHYEHTFSIAPGDYKFQLSLGTGPNEVAKLEAPLEVAPWNGSTLAISAIALSTETHPADPEDSVGLVLEGKGPLTAGGRVFVPASGGKFQRGAPLYLYTEIYDPGAAAGVVVEFEVLDAKTGGIRADSGVGSISGYIRAGSPVIPFATKLTLDKLPPGAYKLEVKAGNQPGALTAIRTADFELE